MPVPAYAYHAAQSYYDVQLNIKHCKYPALTLDPVSGFVLKIECIICILPFFLFLILVS